MALVIDIALPFFFRSFFETRRVAETVLKALRSLCAMVAGSSTWSEDFAMNLASAFALFPAALNLSPSLFFRVASSSSCCVPPSTLYGYRNFTYSLFVLVGSKTTKMTTS